MKRKHIFCILLLNVRFILDSLKKEYYKGAKYPATFDHWRPQHKLCPFCLINFRWEEMETDFVSSSIIFDHFPMQNIFPAWRKWWRRALLLHQSWPWLWLWACEGECAGREGEGCQCRHDAWEVDIKFLLIFKLPNPLFNSDFGVKLSQSWCHSWTSPGPTNTTSRCLLTLRNNTLNRWISANSLPFHKRRLLIGTLKSFTIVTGQESFPTRLQNPLIIRIPFTHGSRELIMLCVCVFLVSLCIKQML